MESGWTSKSERGDFSPYIVPVHARGYSCQHIIFYSLPVYAWTGHKFTYYLKNFCVGVNNDLLFMLSYRSSTYWFFFHPQYTWLLSMNACSWWLWEISQYTTISPFQWHSYWLIWPRRLLAWDWGWQALTKTTSLKILYNPILTRN